MQNETELTEWGPDPPDAFQKSLNCKIVTYESSLIGEYARLLLLLLVVPLAFLYANDSLKHQTGILCFVASLIVFGTLVTSRGYQIIRVLAVGLMIANVGTIAISPDDISGIRNSGLSEWSVLVLLFCLVVAFVFETTACIRSSTRAGLLKTLAWSVFLIPAMIYVIAMPILDSIWITLEGDEKKLAMRDPNWNVVNEAAFRIAKLAVFGVFAYLGACLGSFLNVAAYCIPRGEPIGLRDSKCPGCKTKISRIDNLPIFSYVNLGGKCRSCAGEISPRYLIVEIVVAFIFGSLFLYELVTGCNNVPLMGISHEGILWIILYPKWPAIGIYFFHCIFMCSVLVLALMEWDKQNLKPSFAIVIGLALFASAAAYLPIQPIPLFEHLPGIAKELNPQVEQLLKLLVGSIAGFLIGRVFAATHSASNVSILTFAFVLTGVVLGWQALFQVSVVFAMVSMICRYLAPTRTLLSDSPTTLLLMAITIHHPFWKVIADWWRF